MPMHVPLFPVNFFSLQGPYVCGLHFYFIHIVFIHIFLVLLSICFSLNVLPVIIFLHFPFDMDQ